MSQFNKYLEIIQEMQQYSSPMKNVNLKAVDLVGEEEEETPKITYEILKNKKSFKEIKDNKNLTGYKAVYDGNHAVITKDFKTYHIFKDGKTSLIYVTAYDNISDVVMRITSTRID